MPGRDGTGPAGYGAMTGRGLGICGGSANSGAGMGLRLGCRRGCGRGTGWRYAGEVPPEEALQAQKEILERRLDLVNHQLQRQ
jgi:hypothetical protein